MKKIALAILSIGFIMVFAGCTWQVPEKVSVQTNAKYCFSLGTFEKNLDEALALDSLMGDTGKDHDEISTFDYFPGQNDKKTQHFLIEVKLWEGTILPALESSVLNAISKDKLDISEIPGDPSFLTVNDVMKVDFNPATIMDSFKEALGSDLADKITFTAVPMYFYCKTAGDLKADVNFKIFYADKGDYNVNRNGEIELLDGTCELNNPKPEYEYLDETNKIVVTDLEDYGALVKGKNITKFMNKLDEDGNPLTEVKDDDAFCLSYNISNFSGSITKAELGQDITLTLYAVVDLPLDFLVTEDAEIDISKLTGMSSEESGSSESTENSTESSSSSSDDTDLSQYLDVIEAIKLHYIAYQLPFYSTSGMQLGVSMTSGGDYKWTTLAVAEKGKDNKKNEIKIDPQTVLAIKDSSNFQPNIMLKMDKGTRFSFPREKAIEMNIDIELQTDGKVQIQ